MQEDDRNTNLPDADRIRLLTTPIEGGEDSARATITLDERHEGWRGVPHGGVLFALPASQTVDEALAALLGVRDPLRIILTSNATEALNLALHGLLRRGDHVVTSSMEHNSVMRPLRRLEAEGVAVGVVPAGEDGRLDPAAIVP